MRGARFDLNLPGFSPHKELEVAVLGEHVLAASKPVALNAPIKHRIFSPDGRPIVRTSIQKQHVTLLVSSANASSVSTDKSEIT